MCHAPSVVGKYPQPRDLADRVGEVGFRVVLRRPEIDEQTSGDRADDFSGDGDLRAVDSLDDRTHRAGIARGDRRLRPRTEGGYHVTMTKPVYGLTGGIACGKSTAARIFATLGIPIIDADEVARDVVRPGSPGLAAIVEAFGPDVLGRDGALDRKRLGAIVFADEPKRRALEAITHPLIFMEGRARIAALETTEAPYILHEAALLVETGGYRAFAGLVVVAAHPEVQLARLMARDGLDEEGARARLAAQLPIDRKVELADVTIWNDGGEADLEVEVRRAHGTLLARIEGRTE